MPGPIKTLQIFMPSTLEVTLHDLEGIKDRLVLGSSHTYVVLTCGKEVLKSRVIDGHGENPRFYQKFHFHIENDWTLQVSVRDDLKVGYRRLGTVKIDLKKLMTQDTVSKTSFALEPGILNPGVRGCINFSFSILSETFKKIPQLMTSVESVDQLDVPPGIKKVVVLCMENRSFDHMLGYMDGVNGIKGKEKTYIVEGVEPNDKAKHIQLIDLGHTVHHVHSQLDGKWISDAKLEAKMQLVSSKWSITNWLLPTEEILQKEAETCMQCFTPDQVPVISTLAKEFCVFDSWHCSLAGPTHPNRWFLHCGQSGGCTNNLQMCPSPMVFDLFEDDDYKIYYHDMSGTVLMSKVLIKKFYNKDKKNIRHFDEFYKDAKNGTLPKYSFLEPTYYTSEDDVASDQHPPHDVREGEQLILNVYSALLANPDQFKETLFLIVYDEHGGFFDHVQPPPVPGVKGDVKYLNNGDFKQLGFRVPAIAINPYIKSGTVDSRLFDHCSVPATLLKLFGLKDYLTERVYNAQAFHDVLNLFVARSTQEMPDPQFMQKSLDELKKIPYVNELIPKKIVDKLLCNPRGWIIGTGAFYAIKKLFRGTMKDTTDEDDYDQASEIEQKSMLRGLFEKFMNGKEKTVMERLHDHDAELSDVEIIEEKDIKIY